ncbi:unnamed protein product [Malus baccata var. baccata]
MNSPTIRLFLFLSPNKSFISLALILIDSPESSTIANLTNSATESRVNDPSRSFLGISTPSPFSFPNRALSPWSFTIGKNIKTRPNMSPSIIEFQPQ